MSWSVVVADLQNPDNTPANLFSIELMAKFASQHPLYPSDLLHAHSMALLMGFSTATLAGGRTPNPYGDDEVVTVTVQGMMKAVNYQEEMKRIIKAGPDEEALAHQAAAREVPFWKG